MNLFECIGGGGSSELQETVLWTNSSPTSNFANQTVTLSDDINNYEYLKVYYRISTTNSKTIGILVSVDDFKTTASTMPLINPAGVGGNAGNPAQRYFYYASDTTMAIRDAAVGTTVYNNAVIPTAICGLKYGTPTTGTSLKDAYKNKVNEAGLTTIFLTPYSSRSTVNEGKVAVDTTNHIVYLYADFTVDSTQGTSDYYALLSIPGMSTSYLPQRTSTTREAQSLTTDPNSSVATKSWFAWVSGSDVRISIHKGQGVTQGEHYIIYGSWNY